MERRFSKNLSNTGRGSVSLQKQVVENRRTRSENVPDLTDFMNDMFFGATNAEKKVYNLTGDDESLNDESDDFDSSRRSVSSRSTQEWLEEAKKMVAQSPTRTDSPSRLAGSPRFATSQQVFTTLDKRNPLSRSARRQRGMEGISGEILSKSAQHTRNKSQVILDSQEEESPTSAVQKWLSNILKPQNGSTVPSESSLPPKPINNLGPPPLPPSQSTPRKSRFQKATNAAQSHLIPPPVSQQLPKRTFKNPANVNVTATNSQTVFDTELLSPPKHVVQSAQRRSISSSTCSALSPPRNLLDSARNSISILEPHKPLQRNLLESGHRRSTSTSVPYNQDRILPRDNFVVQYQAEAAKNLKLNGFLKEQRTKMEKIISGESNGKAKIVLSGTTNSTSSMVAAICYAWLLENRMKTDKEGREQEGSNGELVVPVMNMGRGKMWKQKQAAWLFHHVGIDASALLFSDEVDLETMMMTRKLSILMVGQDILKTNGEVGSACTILTDNYCEDAYDLLQTLMLKKILLAGILLDTQNLNASAKLSTTRDSEAIQLLLVGSAPTYRNTLFDKLMLDQRDGAFSEVLEKNYGKPPSASSNSKEPTPEHLISDKNYDHERVAPNADKSPKDVKNFKTNTESPKPGKPAPTPTKPPAAAPAAPAAAAKAADSSRGKNGFFLAKWFGFGSK